VLVADDQVVGFVDLCDLGIADRWLDIAIAPWGLEAAGLGPEWEDQFYRSYGVAPDPDRFAFYRLLYDLKRLLMSVP
jgi:kanamycin kinase